MSKMGLLSLFSNPHLPVLPLHLSIYVHSDTDFAKYKQRQTEAEIEELERLKDSHKSSIERLEKTISELRKSLTTD